MKKRTLNIILILTLIISLVASCVPVGAKNSVSYLFSGGSNGPSLGEIRVYNPSDLSLKTNQTIGTAGIFGLGSYPDEKFIYLGVVTGGISLVEKRWKTNLSLSMQSGSYGGTINSVLVDDTYVYAGGATTLKVYQYWKSNMTKKTETASYGGTINSMVQDDMYIYAGGSTTNKISQYWKTNLTKKADFPDYGGTVFALAINGTYIYAGGGTVNSVTQYWIANRTVRLDTGDMGSLIKSVCADATHVFFIHNNGGYESIIEKANVSDMLLVNFYECLAALPYSIIDADPYLYGTFRDPWITTDSEIVKIWKSNMSEAERIQIHPHSTNCLLYDGIVIEPPLPFTATYSLSSTRNINLAWTKGDAADKTIIRGSTIAYPTSPTSGTAIYNGTGTSYSHTALAPSTTWYYRAWSWNDTVDLVSTDNSTATATTPVNTAPTIGVYTPTCLSFNVSVDILSVSISVSDPESDYPLTWIIVCSNGDFSIGGGTAGNKTCTITAPLNYSTTYTWYINVSDSYGAWRNTSCSFLTELPPYVCNLPQLDDYDISQWGTAAWVSVLGSWFWGGFFGVLGAALYIKTENAVVSMMWFLCVGVLTMAVWPIDMVYMIGIIAGIVIGCLFAALIINR